MNAIKHVLVREKIIEKDELESIENNILDTMQNRRAKKIREATFAESK